MRLTDEQRRVIREAAKELFGPDATVRLFGSRTDDRARGGDIDLLISTSMMDVNAIVRSEVAFQARVQQELGEQKLDLLIDYPGRGERPPIYRFAEETGVRL